MADNDDIIAVAPADAPEELDTDALDEVAGGVKYGGTNTCEPVRVRIADVLIASYQTGGSSVDY